MITIGHVDHMVLTVRSIAQTCEFYQRALNMEVQRFDGNMVEIANYEQAATNTP